MTATRLSLLDRNDRVLTPYGVRTGGKSITANLVKRVMTERSIAIGADDVFTVRAQDDDDATLYMRLFIGGRFVTGRIYVK